MTLSAVPFSIRPGQCFALVEDETNDAPVQCEGEVAVRGLFIDSAGGRHPDIEACEEHAGLLAIAP